MFWTDEVIRAEHDYRREAMLRAGAATQPDTGGHVVGGFAGLSATLRRLLGPQRAARHAVVK